MWYKIKFGGYTGWAKTPYTYSSSDSYFSINPKFLTSNVYTPWTSAPGVQYFSSLKNKTSVSLNEKLASQSNLTIVVYPEIYWKKKIPFLRVDIVKSLNVEEWCSQSKKPEVLKMGYIKMFNEKNELNIIKGKTINCD
jgi:hypothetical protein